MSSPMERSPATESESLPDESEFGMVGGKARRVDAAVESLWREGTRLGAF